MSVNPSDSGNPAAALQAALDADQFCLFCQAIVSLSSQSKGRHFYEVLLRSIEEEKGFAIPGTFFEVAAEYHMLPALDRWVVRNVLRWASQDPARQRAGFSLNLSAASLHDDDFGDYVTAQLEQTGLPGTILCFEISEADAVRALSSAVGLARQLKAAGCRIALSAFGRVSSSMELLRMLPVDMVKIDGDIISHILTSPMELAKVKAIQQVAHTQRIRTIATFVEDGRTMTKLREMGVNYVQGFGVAKPVPIDDAEF
jgi:EAL domain-containing protein (putative c-di-GMP-specific phosphodiesterase class I)